jgi:endonuclease G, mitochondrial
MPKDDLLGPSNEGLEAAEDIELRAALAAVEAARERPYYDEPADRQERELFYQGIDPAAGGVELYLALSELLEHSHGPRPAYQPTRLVYPWVDLHPDALLRSIYSGRSFTAEELVRADLEAERARSERLVGLVRGGVALGPRELEAEFDALEQELPFNCEHVVPQSWFAKREPMRGDLHHLFACESRCNSFRGNWPYFDFEERERTVREHCGRLEAEGFQPSAGKGPAARATLYFLLRYPRQLGDTERELTAARLELLVAWHQDDPVSDYERHRNAAIAELQGNRNPLIDRPDWARTLDFSAAWA